jgi:hypothetical protein
METRTDTERLDWLEENKQCLFVITIKKRRGIEHPESIRTEEYTEVLGWSVGNDPMEWDSPRRAIDEAMDSSES